MNERIIDTHPHIISKDTVRYPITPIGGVRSHWSAERSVDFSELRKAMLDAGIAQSVLVHSSTTYGFNNDYVADSIADYRKKFAGVFSVNVTQDDATERMRYWMSRGMSGMRIYVQGTTIAKAWMNIDDPSYDAAWQCAAELGISVCVNVIARDEGIDQLRNVLERYPSVPLVIDHTGRPALEDGPPYNAANQYWSLAKYKNFYLKLTPTGMEPSLKGHASPDSFLKQMVSVFGADHIAWGSNFPSAKGSLKDIVTSARELMSTLSVADRREIFSGTAERLYPSLKG